MREFLMLPVVAVLSLLALIALPLVAVALAFIGALFWIGERQGWGCLGGCYREDNAGQCDDA